MILKRKNANIIGVLFLTALVFNLIASAISDPVLRDADFLHKVYAAKNLIIIGSMLNIICAIAMIFIPIYFYPVVKERDKNLALGYIVFWSLEGILFIYIAIKTLSIIQLSKAFIQKGTQHPDLFQLTGDSIHSELHWANVIYIVIFCLGAMTFYFLLYRSNLVPKFLSVWGFLAAIYLLTGALSGMFGLLMFSDMPLMEGIVYFAPAIALNEFVLSVWLLMKGFNENTNH